MVQLSIYGETPIEEIRELRTLLNQDDRSIYDDVAQLQTTVENLENLIAQGGFLESASEDLNNKDLNTCIGKIIIGYGNNCVNKPTSTNGYFINIPHNDKPNLYGKQFWITRATNDIYMRNLENGTFSGWVSIRTDSGWIDLPLANGISSYSSTQSPQYRKINNTVYIRGAVKGIRTDKTIIATLPSGFRPTKVVSFVQNMSMSGGVANMVRWQVQTDGDIEMQYTNHSLSEYTGDEWFALDVNFLND